MSTHPLMTYELAVVHDRALIEHAAVARSAGTQPTPPKSALARLGSLLIAAGERLGGARVPQTPDLAGAAR
ncbi:MAG TPA: hypothetical protein VH482_19655 [Thermomicrobiales bacterium]